MYKTDIVALPMHIQHQIETSQSVRKFGKWEMCEDDNGVYGVCSVCGEDADFSYYGKAYAFCPNCGADMRSDEECIDQTN